MISSRFCYVLCLIVGRGSFCNFFQPQNHLILGGGAFCDFLSKRAETFMFLGVFAKITQKHLITSPPILWIFLGGIDPTIRHRRVSSFSVSNTPYGSINQIFFTNLDRKIYREICFIYKFKC